MVFHIFFGDLSLSCGVGKARKFVFERFSRNPVGCLEAFHLGPFHNEDRSEEVFGLWGRGKGVEKAFRIFKRGDELVAVRKKDVFAVRLEGEKF